VTPAACPNCLDTGHACENHPDKPWDGIHPDGCPCGGAGMPCPTCCDEVSPNDARSILDAFTPRHLRVP